MSEGPSQEASQEAGLQKSAAKAARGAAAGVRGPSGAPAGPGPGSGNGAGPGPGAGPRPASAPGPGPGDHAVSLLDILRVGVVMLDGEGRVLLWSPMTEEILGWHAGEVAGRPIREYLHESAVADAIGRTLRHEQHWRGILHLRHREGHLVEAEGRVALLRDAEERPFVLANLVEASRLRAVEHDLAALDALFASSPLGIALLDTDKRFVRINPALCRLNGLPAEAYLGKTVDEVLPVWMAQLVGEVQTTVLETGRPVIDMMTPAPDGVGSRSVSYGRLTDHNGDVLGVSCTIMDITERREALAKVEAARQRLALLDDVGVALGDLLDVRAVSQALASALVPRFADYAGVLLLSSMAHNGELPETELLTGTPLLQAGVAARYQGPAVDRMLRGGQDIAFQPGSFVGKTLATGTPHLAATQDELLAATYPGDPKVQAAIDLGIHSLMAVPLRARGIVLGLLVISRAGDREAFDHDDLALTMELADRASTSLDNARLYAREREVALMLQRSLLPQRVPEPPGVRVAYRYVPASSGTEAGGDWFDVIPLAGGRVAFVVGDVMGHGLRAAATMGRLRTAVRTLAGLDLPPEELLRRVNDLADDFAQGPDDPLIATCLYAVYDPSTRRCTLCKAGHVPPLLITPSAGGGCRTRALDLPSGAPLGVSGIDGSVDFESVEMEVPEGAVLVLYTDGLIEKRHEDITEGVDRLCATLSRGGADGAPARLEEICDTVLSALEHAGREGAPGGTGGGTGDGAGDGTADDAALLLATLGGLPEGSAASWTFSAQSYAVRRARDVIRQTLHEWGLEAIEDEAVLLVSELVTNSLRYAHGPIGVRMVRGGSLLVEVSDPLPDPPRERSVTEEDEGGRGMQLVAREARRWGTRHGPMGKTVWFELALP